MNDITKYKTQGAKPFDDHDVECYTTRDNLIGITINTPYDDGGNMILLDCRNAEQLIANLLACVERVRLYKSTRK